MSINMTIAPAVLLLIACTDGEKTSDESGGPDTDLTHDIQPLVEQYCVRCHVGQPGTGSFNDYESVTADG